MRQMTFAAGITALAISMPALADTPTTLYPNIVPSTAATPDIVAEGYPVPPPYPQTPPPYPSADMPPAPPPVSSPVAVVPTPPSPPEIETPPPAPSPTYVWEPGHWYWNGLQYHWQPGKYVAKPTATATYKPGHWEQRPEGWVWVDSEWSYRAQGTGE